MLRKNLVIGGTICAIAVSASALLFFLNDKSREEVKQTEIPKAAEEVKTQEQESPKVQPPKIEVKKEEVLKPAVHRADLFNDISNSQLPLTAIFELSKLPEDIQNIIKETFETTNSIYMVKNNGKDVLVLTENSENNRHGLELMVINLTDKGIKKSNLGNNEASDNTNYDIWDYDKKSASKRPLKHTKFSPDGDVEYTEYWNYSDEDPVKYEMKNSEDKIVSIKKETIDNGTDMRLEHLFYDEDGNIKMNISVSFEGPDIKRFTYFDADKPNESISVFSEYENGLKTKEKVYTSDYKLKNTYEVNYNNDGERTDITVLDNENKEVAKVLSK